MLTRSTIRAKHKHDDALQALMIVSNHHWAHMAKGLATESGLEGAYGKGLDYKPICRDNCNALFNFLKHHTPCAKCCTYLILRLAVNKEMRLELQGELRFDSFTGRCGAKTRELKQMRAVQTAGSYIVFNTPSHHNVRGVASIQRIWPTLKEAKHSGWCTQHNNVCRCTGTAARKGAYSLRPAEAFVIAWSIPQDRPFWSLWDDKTALGVTPWWAEAWWTSPLKRGNQSRISMQRHEHHLPICLSRCTRQSSIYLHNALERQFSK